MSRGVSVVAEHAFNRAQYPELERAVAYFHNNSIRSLLHMAHATIEFPPSEATFSAAVANSQRRFQFMFARFLISAGMLSPSNISRVQLHLPAVTTLDSNAAVVLSMPEFNKRRRRFLQNAPASISFAIFDGIVLKPSWIGCAASYMVLARHAVSIGTKQLLVVEDDVIFPPNFSQRLAAAKQFLTTLPAWDMFSGLIVDVTPETSVLDAQFVDGTLYVVLDRMTSTVCNLYNRHALELLAQWDMNDRNDQTNTIDRYLNRRNMTVVTTMPYMVDHERGTQSTLWKIEPDHYSKWIQRSQEILLAKTMAFLARRRMEAFHVARVGSNAQQQAATEGITIAVPTQRAYRWFG